MNYLYGQVLFFVQRLVPGLAMLIGKKIRNERTGLYAAVLYNTSIYSSIIAGTFILPDSPAGYMLACRIACSYTYCK